MMSKTLIAVAAPVVHTETGVAPQNHAAPVSAANYLGGAAILTILAVMVVSGLSAAGILSFRRSTRVAASDTAHTAH